VFYNTLFVAEVAELDVTMRTRELCDELVTVDVFGPPDSARLHENLK
jgi:hypothetical protein